MYKYKKHAFIPATLISFISIIYHWLNLNDYADNVFSILVACNTAYVFRLDKGRLHLTAFYILNIIKYFMYIYLVLIKRSVVGSEQKTSTLSPQSTFKLHTVYKT